jgi:phosphoglycolate phosphatase-like HAD superfamily hydrolase
VPEPRAVVLDVDGTLVDSVYQHTFAWSRAFRTAGHPVEAWRIHRHIGMGGDRLVAAVAGADVEESSGDRIREIWEAEYDAVIGDVGPLEDACELLSALKDRGIRIALASSSIPKHAQHAFDLLDAERYADLTTTSEDVEESKPDQELVAFAMKRLGTGNALMVGDAVWDVVAASHAGIPTIGLCCGGYGRHELLDAGATAVYHGPGDLLAHLDLALETGFGLSQRAPVSGRSRTR